MLSMSHIDIEDEVDLEEYMFVLRVNILRLYIFFVILDIHLRFATDRFRFLII